MREGELRAAAAVLRVEDSCLLDYRDGELAKADAAEAVARIVVCIRRFRPDVVVTFDQNGLYGHPDHIAISQLATAAVAAAGDPGYVNGAGQAPHSVSKLYYMVWTEEERKVYEDAFGELTMEIDGQRRGAVLWPEWAVTTRIDATAHWRQVWRAVQCHRTQLPNYEALVELPEATHEFMWGRFKYYRVFSRVNGGPEPEDDLFAGLR
jgi:LmbE family N-acetylglucosaminyl deacetylase